jgi:hypothetical protein
MGSILVEKWGASLCRKMGSVHPSQHFGFLMDMVGLFSDVLCRYPLVANPRGVKESERIGRREIVVTYACIVPVT